MEKQIIAAAAVGTLAIASWAGLSIAADYSPPKQVNIAVTYDESGEVEHVELTDSEGRTIPVGSVAEDREAMYPAEYENTDTEED